MKTDKIKVKSDGAGITAALNEVAKFSEYEDLDKKPALRLRLLAEETLGMVSAITGDFEADFWLEGSKDDVCKINLVAHTMIDYEKKRELIEASSDKKNASAKGFMGKIQEMIENSIYGVEETGDMAIEMGDPYFMHGMLGIHDPEFMNMTAFMNQWSLNKYRQSIDMGKGKDQGADEAKDELEKSIVASIADEVKVGVKGDTVELVIEYKAA